MEAGLFVILFSLVWYLLPLIIAASRGHNNTLAIAVVSVLFGWTGIGWIVGIVWACTSNTEANTAKGATQ